MLNISENRIIESIKQSDYKALMRISRMDSGRVFLKLLAWFFGITLVFMFLPWTQNIRANGSLTTLKPNQRPQTLHSVIDGRIEKWYVQEGESVEKGDTILFISEIKDQYFDPDLLERTQIQLNAKEASVKSYEAKVDALKEQINALEQMVELKFKQTQNKYKQALLKVKSDSIKLEVANTNYQIADKQLNRIESLYESGLKSLTELENRKLTRQKTVAEQIAAENQLLSSRNELINAQVELTSIRAHYRESISKAKSEMQSALSNFYDSEAAVAKLENQYTNYSIRSGMYFIKAPQSGYITQTMYTGIGENVKEGSPILTIMPSEYDLVVELYVNPIDLPLVQPGQEVRIQFDGWPAIVFSGWPNTSYGTYGGEVYAIDNFISPNGKFRILVKPNPEQPEWPHALRVGGGTNNMMLLEDVPVWYELWRQINGFPPNFYVNIDGENKGNQNSGLKQ
jgi:multidrug resistance efflux pump